MECKVCKNSVDNKQFTVSEMMFDIGEKFEYLECSSCGCLQLIDQLDDLAKYYPDNYYSYNSSESTGIKKRLADIFIKYRDKYAILNKGVVGKMIHNFRPAPTFRLLSEIDLNLDSKIMDVGCGSGRHLLGMKNVKFNNLLGVDPFIEKDIKYDNGLEIVKKYIHDIKGKWDLIMFHHSFEHMDNPQETMNTVSELLEDNGTCLIRVPTSSSYAWEHYKEKWVQIDAPRHYFLHSLKSMEILAENAGLEIERVEFDSNAYQFWASEQIIKGISVKGHKTSYAINPSRSIFTKVQIEEYENRAKLLNKDKRGDQCAFYLRKKTL